MHVVHLLVFYQVVLFQQLYGHKRLRLIVSRKLYNPESTLPDRAHNSVVFKVYRLRLSELHFNNYWYLRVI